MDTQPKNVADQLASEQPTFRVVATSRGPVEFAEAGSGPPILYFHGTGAAGNLVFDFERPLFQAGFRLIVPNRPVTEGPL